jgi:hypothetical protein
MQPERVTFLVKAIIALYILIWFGTSIAIIAHRQHEYKNLKTFQQECEDAGGIPIVPSTGKNVCLNPSSAIKY